MSSKMLEKQIHGVFLRSSKTKNWSNICVLSCLAFVFTQRTLLEFDVRCSCFSKSWNKLILVFFPGLPFCYKKELPDFNAVVVFLPKYSRRCRHVFFLALLPVTSNYFSLPVMCWFCLVPKPK
jgi:hypothetical protein